MEYHATRYLLYEGSYKTSFEHLSEGQRQACQIVLRIASVLSILGSGFIIYNLLGPRRESELKETMFSRLLLGLCISDLCSSVALFFGAWPIPKDSFHEAHLHDNAGTRLTCNVQGFALQVFYFASIFYTASLSINFLLCVKYNWKERELKKKVEPWLHVTSWAIPMVLAVICLVFEMFNPTAFFCYVVTYPIGCDHYDDVPCIRGDRSWMWRSIAQIVPFGVCFLTIVYSMVMIYRTVREQEQAVARYSNAWIKRKARNSRMALTKAAQYIGVFVAVWTPVLLVALSEDLGQKIPFAIWMIDAFMIPIVGLFNGIVYSKYINPIDSVRRSVTSSARFASSSRQRHSSNSNAMASSTFDKPSSSAQASRPFQMEIESEDLFRNEDNMSKPVGEQETADSDAFDGAPSQTTTATTTIIRDKNHGEGGGGKEEKESAAEQAFDKKHSHPKLDTTAEMSTVDEEQEDKE